jgi:hypothetical protein
MGLLAWCRSEVDALRLAWTQYKCPHDDVETTPYGVDGVRRRCRKCGLVWTILTKGPG